MLFHFQNVVWFGKRQLFCFLIMYIMCSFLQLFQMPVSLLNGSAIFTNRLYFWYAVPLSLLSCDIILSVWLITGSLSIFLVILLQIGDGIDQSWFSGCIPAFAGILAVASTWQHSSCFLMFIFHNYLGTCLISANIELSNMVNIPWFSEGW